MAASPPQARIFTAVWLGSSVLRLPFCRSVKIPVALDIGYPRHRDFGSWDQFSPIALLCQGMSQSQAQAHSHSQAQSQAQSHSQSQHSAGTVAGAEERSSRPMARRLLDCGVLVALLIVAIKMPDDFGAGQRSRAVFVMLTMGLLPLVNAVFDFASVGLTRYLLRLGLEQKRAAWPAVLWTGWAGLPFSLPWDARSSAFVTFVVPADGVPLVGLTQLFADMRRAPGDYIWLMVTLFSTLLPTLLHLSVAVLTLGLQYPAGVRNFVADLLERGEQSGQAALLSGICICAMITIALWCPIWIFTFVVTHDHGAIVNAVLWGFEAFAWAIGGI